VKEETLMKNVRKRARRGLWIGLQLAGLYGVALGCQPVESATGDLWQRQLGSSDDDALYSVALSGSSLYAVGSTRGRLPDAPAGSALGDGYIVQASPSGQIGWQKQLGTAGTDEWRGVATDSAGNLYVVGFTDNTFAGQTKAGGDSDAVIARIKPDGSLDWLRQFGTTGADFLVAVAVDSSGAAYAVGSTTSNFPGQTLRGTSDGFIVKYRSDGTQESLSQFGSAKDDALTSIASDGAGGFFLGGWATDSVAAGQTALGGRDAALYRFVPGGGVSWAVQLGSPSDDEVQAVAAGSGTVFIGGRTAGPMTGQTFVGRLDGFVGSLDASGGSLRWLRQVGTLFEDEIFALLPQSQGEVIAGGYVSLALPSSQYVGGKDAAFFRFGSDGSSIYASQFGTYGDDSLRGVVANPAGGAFAVGTTNGTITGQVALGKTDAFLGSYRLK
jgi:hypothetical protein